MLAAPVCLYCLDGGQSDGWPTQKMTWPREVAGVRVADSKFTRIAAEALLDCSPAFLLNHAMPTFHFGALIGREQKMTVDEEILFLACALHDLGLTTRCQGSLPFEI